MVRDIMSRQLVSVDPDTKVSEVAKLMEQMDVGAVLVLDNERPRGLITDRDIIVRCVAKNLDVDDTTIENVLSEPLDTVKDTDGMFECIQIMKAAQVRRIPVVNAEGKAVGILSFGDILAILGKEIWNVTEVTTRSKSQKMKAA